MKLILSRRTTRRRPVATGPRLMIAGFVLLLACRSDVTPPADLLDVELTVPPLHPSVAAGQDEYGVLVTCDVEFRLAVSGGTVDLGEVAEFTYRTDHLIQQHTTLGRVFGESARAGQIRTISLRRTFWGPWEMRLQLPWRPRGEGEVRLSEALTRCE